MGSGVTSGVVVCRCGSVTGSSSVGPGVGSGVPLELRAVVSTGPTGGSSVGGGGGPETTVTGSTGGPDSVSRNVAVAGGPSSVSATERSKAVGVGSCRASCRPALRPCVPWAAPTGRWVIQAVARLRECRHSVKDSGEGIGVRTRWSRQWPAIMSKNVV